MKNKKRILVPILAASLINLATFPAMIQAEEMTEEVIQEEAYEILESEENLVEGKCGPTAQFNLNLKTKELKIYGTGETYNWKAGSPAATPWSYYYKEIESVVVDSGITKIGDYAFVCCYNLKNVNFASSVEKLGEGVFQNCSSLTNFTIPSHIKTVGAYAFRSCPNLQRVTFEDGVKSIGRYAFENCSALEYVALSNDLESISKGTFADCTSLTYVDFNFLSDPKLCLLTSIEDYAFEGCTKLVTPLERYFSTAVHLTTIGGSAFSESGIQRLALPTSVQTIGPSVFKLCPNLQELTINEGVTTIPARMAYESKELTSVTIPSSVTSIEKEAFYNTTSLKDVYYQGTPEQWANISIDTTRNDPLFKAQIHYGDPMHSSTQDEMAPVYRLYNRLTGEHLFTIDPAERDALITSDTWKHEGESWTLPFHSEIPIYRLLNPNTTDHHYTVDVTEYDDLQTKGWIGEGIAFYGANQDKEENTILRRLYNPNAKEAGSHHYTLSAEEHDALVAKGWISEGTAWNVFASK